MIVSSSSPTLHPQPVSSCNVYSRPHCASSGLSSAAAAATAAALRRSYSVSSVPIEMKSNYFHSSPRSTIPTKTIYFTRDASTQYSSPETSASERSSLRGKRKANRVNESTAETVRIMSEEEAEDAPPKPRLTPNTHAMTPAQPRSTTAPPLAGSSSTTIKPITEIAAAVAQIPPPSQPSPQPQQKPTTQPVTDPSLSPSSSKRPRPLDPAEKTVSANYSDCPTTDLVPIIADMLSELIRHNDTPLTDTGLTRFHSRAPPGISVRDYLQRLAHHATLSPPILLCMVYYIDRLCALWPKFTINSLTVHRYLIASATVASKGLSDSFWTNSTYARVGGVSLKELALLELEFLWRIEWRIVPKPEVLVDYYRSLVERCEGYRIAEEESGSGSGSGEASGSASGSEEEGGEVGGERMEQTIDDDASHGENMIVDT